MKLKSTNSFINEDFLLENKFSKILYFDFASKMPIIDYHNHLSPKAISENKKFSNINSVWLDGDHYKWRVMRSLGFDESFITGDASNETKFNKWSEAVPLSSRNPIFHWTHLELKRYFNIDKILQPSTANEIYLETNRIIKKKSPVDLIVESNVKILCTTDDPIDDLKNHIKFSKNENKLKMLPTFRPDLVFNITSDKFLSYISSLSKKTNFSINSYESLIFSLSKRIDFFHDNGCRLSDHGFEHIYAQDYKKENIEKIFVNKLSGISPTRKEALMYKSSILYDLCCLYAKKGWTQQFHLGAIRNNNSNLFNTIGPDVGCDSIGDFSQAQKMSSFFNKLNSYGLLTNTIVYNLNPSMNEVFASMIGNFSSSNISMHHGSAWWYLDQKDGIEKQINSLSSVGVISKFIGMVTDSRSFLSFPRHEYFRRIISNIFGNDIKKGLIPNDLDFYGKIIQDICFNNAEKSLKL